MFHGITSNLPIMRYAYVALIVLATVFSMYGLLTKCGVKMAGYWPSSLFACLWTETKSRSINSQKKERARGQYPAILTEQTWSIKNLLYDFSGKFFMRDTAGSPERARWLHLARSDSQSQRAIWFILPARGASHIIRCGIK